MSTKIKAVIIFFIVLVGGAIFTSIYLSNQDKVKTTKNHDIVIIDFKGYIKNKPFPGGEADDYKLALGSNSFIPGFEKQLVNKKVGSTVTVKVRFPKNYSQKEYANKDAIFKVKIKKVEYRPPITKD